ncbi:MAG: alpha/beta fold hydrolase [Nitrosomonas sp.]|nr:alpha/beta fold hydrolase [Nitrosomonas sp.]MCW5607854.1 alpha/beta fold hydrolase [Nitrosomonas sp.]
MKSDSIPLYTEPYIAPKWLRGGNAQTIYPYLMRQKPLFVYRRVRWELDDSDFIDVDWLDGNRNAPLVVIFHGLEGGSNSHYIISIKNILQQYGWHSVVIHFRSCSGEPNRLPRAYHAGDSTEIDWMVRRIVQEYRQTNDSDQPTYAIGVSLGGNALLKWLGEQGEEAKNWLNGIAAVSVPLDLAAAGVALDSGFNQVYTHHFLSTLKHKAFEKLKKFPDLFNAKTLAQCRSIYDFDNIVTAPLHGFKNTDDYWQKSSSKQFLPHISVPTLVINALNDPFMPAAVLPSAGEVSAAVTLDYPDEGGHAGFIQAPFPGSLEWLPRKIVSFFHHQCR